MKLSISYRGFINGKGVSRWIENLSRIYRVDRMDKNLAQWIKEVVKNVLSRNPKILMDREAVEIYREKRKKAR